MVLHLRKLIAVALALIIMVSASSAFALENNQEVCNEDVQVTETVATEEPVATEKNAATDEITPSQDKEITEQIPVSFAYLTLCDEKGTKVLDEEKMEIQDNVAAREFVEKTLEDNNLEYRWEDLLIRYNDEEITDENFEEQIIKSGDKLFIIVSKAEQSEAPHDEREFIEEEVSLSVQASKDSIDSTHKGAISKATSIMDAADWSFLFEWGVIGLSRINSVSEADAKKYCTSLATYIDEIKTAKLNETKSSDNARTVLALTALGYYPTDVLGYNLLEPLADFEYASTPYLSGPIWSLIAIDSHNYSIPQVGKGKTQTTREGLVEAILDSRVGDGWAYSGTVPDVDMTCMAIQALAPYRTSNSKVKAAIDAAVNWLSKQQNSNGSYRSYGVENSESASQVIAALTALGIDPNTDSRFIKNGKSVVDSLISFKLSDGGFKHIDSDVKYNNLATFQGCYALTAYKRFMSGNLSLYDMTDITLVEFGATPAARDKIIDKIDKDVKPETGGASAMGKTFSLGGKTIKLGTTDISGDLTGTENATGSKNVYNSVAEKQKLMRVLPWIYCGIGALAALALVLLLRNRKAE